MHGGQRALVQRNDRMAGYCRKLEHRVERCPRLRARKGSRPSLCSPAIIHAQGGQNVSQLFSVNRLLRVEKGHKQFNAFRRQRQVRADILFIAIVAKLGIHRAGHSASQSSRVTTRESSRDSGADDELCARSRLQWAVQTCCVLSITRKLR